jgi:Rrf2 family protein
MSYSLSFSKSILVVIFISDKIRQGQHEFLSTATISEVLNIPKPTLVKILQSLSHAGLIQTREGKHGGIRLQKDPKQISILDIFNAVEMKKPLFNTDFNIHAKGKRPDAAKVLLLDLFNRAEKNVHSELSNVSIANLLDDMSG